jgi:iron complex transport system permease protein
LTLTQTGRVTRWFILASTLLLITMGISLSVGAVAIPIDEILSWVTGRLPDGSLSGRVLSGVRLPRTLAAVSVGAALAAAGTALQGIQRTPVVDAHLMGISGAAGLGVAIGYAIAPAGASTQTAVILGAVAGIGYGLMSRRFAAASSGSIVGVLVGIAAGLTLMAWTGLFVLLVDSAQVPTLSFFIFGSLSGVSWSLLAATIPLVIISIAVLWWLGPGLDVLTLGEQASMHLGFNAHRNIPLAFTAIGVGIGAAVALGGVIGFVGLIVPLAIRPMLGNIHRLTVPASAIGGAITVVVFDTMARTIAAPVEIPIGLLTAAVGGPVLVWLVRSETAR